MQKTDTAIAKRADTPPVPKDIKGLLEHETTQGQLASVMPEDAKPERLLRLALSALRQTPGLLKCTPASFFGSLIGACALGLEVNTPAGEAYLVPFKVKGKPTCTLIVGYRGLSKLAYQHEKVVSIARHAVKANDVFRIAYGTEETIVHEPKTGDRGPTIGAYAVVKLANGGSISKYMPLDEINSHRPSHWESTPWGDKNEHVVDEMRTKTVLKSILKDTPSTANARRAVTIDEATSRGAVLHANLEDLTAEPAIVEPDQGLAAVDPDALEGPPVNGAADPTEKAFKKLQPAAQKAGWSDEDLEASLVSQGAESTASELRVTL